MTELVKGFTLEELEYKIESEGIEYFFLSYISPENVKDKELKIAVEKFKDSFSDIISILQEHGLDVE